MRVTVTLASALLAWSPPAATQALIGGPMPSGVLSSVRGGPLRIDLTQRSDSLEDAAQQTHWKEGAVVGGLVGAVGGAVLGTAVCKNSEEIGKSCTGTAVESGLIAALVLPIPCTLIGGQIPQGGATE